MKIIYRIISIILLAYLSPNLTGDENSDSKTPLSDSERGIPREASQDKKIQGIGQLLLEAAQNSDLPKIESALATGADINYADSENRTALYFSYEKEKTEIISYLKKNGAKETNLTKLFRIERNCYKEYEKQNYKGVIKETERIQKEKIEYDALFQKEDKSHRLSLEQNIFVLIIDLRGESYLTLREFKLAIPDYEFIIKKYSSLNVYHALHYAYALSEATQSKKAIVFLENSSKLFTEKDNALIYFGLAWCYYRDNRIDEAIDLTEKSIKIGGRRDYNFFAGYFNNSLLKFNKGDYEAGWIWFFYSFNRLYQLDLEARKNLVKSAIYDFEHLLKKSERKSKHTMANVNTALWFLRRMNQETNSSIINLRNDLPISQILKTISETPFSEKINTELKYLIAAYFSIVKNFTEADRALGSLCKEHGYSFYERALKDEYYYHYNEMARKNQKGFYQKEEIERKKVKIVIQNGHSSSVAGIAFSPDGSMLLSGSGDNTIKLWDLSGKLLHTFVGHSSDVTSIAFSPDGKQIISGSHDETIKLWDISGRLLHTFEGHSSAVESVAFSPDGDKILSGARNRIMKVWDVSGRLLNTFDGHDYRVSSVAFSPDGKRMISGSSNGSLKNDTGTIKLWDITGKLLRTYEGHSFPVTSVVFSPDGKKILSGSWDKSIKLWEINGKLLHTFEGHSNQVTSVSFSPDGTRILSGSWDNTIKLWESSGKLLHTFEGHSGAINGVAFSPNGKQILFGSIDHTMKLLDTSGKLIHSFNGYSSYVRSASFNLDGKHIVAVSDYGKIKLWDATGKLLNNLDSFSKYVSSAVFSPDGKKILSGSSDNTIKLLDTAGNLIHTFEGHSMPVTSIAFNSDGNKILSGSSDKTIKLWDISGKLLRTYEGHSSSILSVAFSPDGNNIISGSDNNYRDNTLKLWDISGKLLYTFDGYLGSVDCVAFSPDGKQVIYGSSDKSYRNDIIKLWDISGKMIHTFEGHLHDITSVAFSPDGKQIISGSLDKTIKLWDISGKLLHTFKGHSSGITNASFSPDGKLIVSASNDTTIKLWDVEERALVATLIAFKDGEGLVYTPDGRFDYTSGKVKDYVSYRKGNEFIDLSDMFNHFYEPGLLEKVLAGDTTKGKQESTSLDEKFKDRPVIKVKNIDPQKKIKAEDNKRNLLFSVKDQGSGITEVMVYVNGHLLSGNWKDFSEDLEIDIPLVAGVNKVEIKGYNKYRIPKTYAMELTKEAASDEVLDKPDLYLLAVGINEYKESKLKFSVNDAKAFASVIEKKSKGLFGNVVVKSLLDKEASKRNIEDAISEIKKQAKAKDVVMLYFSGHGNTAIKENPLSGENPKLFYFVPADFGWKDLDMDSETVARNQGVDADYINKSISVMLPHKVVLILDACQSGDVQIAMRSGNKTKLARQQMERLANGTGRFILTSSAGNELSREIPTLGHGVFTYVLLQALEEADNDKSGDISLREIGRYIEDKFEEKTKPYLKDIIQSPSPLIQLGRDSASARVNDFPLVKSK